MKRLKTDHIFALIAFFRIFVFRTPLLWGTDETSHIARVYQLSEGDVRANTLGMIVSMEDTETTYRTTCIS